MTYNLHSSQFKKFKLWALVLLLIVLGAHITFSNIPIKTHMVCMVSDTCRIPHFVSKLYIRTASKQKLQDKSYGGNVIHFVVGMWDKSKPSNHINLKQLLEYFVKQGVNINEYSDSGLTPLLSSILTFDPDLVSFLINKGADPTLPIESSNEKLNGITPVEYVGMLIQEGKADRDSLLAIKNILAKNLPHPTPETSNSKTHAGSGTIKDDFDGDGKKDTIQWKTDKEKATIVIMGTVKTQTIELPIDPTSQQGLCGADVEIKSESANPFEEGVELKTDEQALKLAVQDREKKGMKGFGVYAGECDAFHFFYNPILNEFQYDRS